MSVRAALSVATVIGKTFSTQLLATVLSQESAQLRSLLEPAQRLGLQIPNAGPEPGFTFAHKLLADHLYAELPEDERGAIHGRVARTLAQRRAEEPHAFAAVAHHRLRAIPLEVDHAVAACREAASAAREAACFARSARILGEALMKLEQLGAGDELRFSLLLEMGEGDFYAGHPDSAWTAFCRAAEVATRSGQAGLMAMVAPRMLDCFDCEVGDPLIARALVERALDSATPMTDASRACLLVCRAVLESESPPHVSQALAEQAAALAGRSGVAEARVEVAFVRATMRDPRRLAQCASAAQELLQLFEQQPAAAARLRYRGLRGFGAHLTRYLCALATGDLASASLHFEQCRQAAECSHLSRLRYLVDLIAAARALTAGHLDELQRLVARLEPEEGGVETFRHAAWSFFAEALSEAHGSETGPPAVDTDSSLLRRLPNSKFVPQRVLLRARKVAATGDLERARALVAPLLGSFAHTMPVHYGDLGVLCTLAEVLLSLEDRASLAMLYELLLPYTTFNAVGPFFESRGAVAHFLGLMAERLQRPLEAIEHLETALTINTKLGMEAAAAASAAALQRLVAERKHPPPHSFQA